MLQSATKLINSAFKDSFIKRLSMYLHDCVSEEIRSCSFKNLNQDKSNKWLFLGQESADILHIYPDRPIKIKDPTGRAAEMMVQADASKKDYQLIYGFLFLKGKSSAAKKNEDFLTPLLYMPCRLERNGLEIDCMLQDDYLSLNTSALVSLMEFDEEDETAEHLLDGLIDYIPDLPLTKEKIQIFLGTLKAIIPDVEISHIMEDKAVNSAELLSDTLEELTVIDVSAVILTKRPVVLAGLLHELSEIADKPVGVVRETALSPILEENLGAIKNKKAEKPEKLTKIPITPLDLSESQQKVIEAIKNNTIVTVFGPPGTGKSQTIVNIASHLAGSGKTVLIASKMDKAVDVVSNRLNDFGAKFLCLRAGKPDYQKLLSLQLTDFISGKVDLDAGFESSVLTEVDDLEVIRKNKEDLEKKCLEIMALEDEWNGIFKQYEEAVKLISEEKHINASIYADDIHFCRKLLDKTENICIKSGFLNNLQTKILLYRLNKKINAKLSSQSQQNLPEKIEQIRRELDTTELKEKLKKIEAGITKNGNLSQIFENLKQLRGKYKETVVEILKNKRRETLKALIRDQYKRQRLIIHSKALVERRKNLQNRVLLNEDFTPLLEAFPCFAVTSQAVSESLPLEPGLFDVVIIDESSQCDIAGCIPILFRAKRAIIVGDDKQLPHLSFLEKAKEQSFLNKYNIPDKYQLMWKYRTNSMFDVANYYAGASVMLDEHFRSFPEIIDFSNSEFYGGRMKIMKKKAPTAGNDCCIELVVVDNAKVDLDTTRNMAETEKIIDKIHEIIDEDARLNPDNPRSIGIVSPFRGQVELVKKALYRVFTFDIIKKHRIDAGTAHTFQGDERDIMLVSFTIAPNSHFQSIIFAQKPNLFNVAITRARKKLICYISRPPETLPEGLLRNYLEYIQAVSSPDKRHISVNPDDPVKIELIKMLKGDNCTEEITLTGKELGEYKDIAELRKLAIDFYKNNIQGKTVEHPELGEIKFTKVGRDEVVSQTTHNAILFYRLMDIIKTSKYARTEIPKHNRFDGIIKFHILENKVIVGKIPGKYEFFIGEDNRGNKFYFIKDYNNDEIGSRNRQTVTGTTESNINITDFEDNFKDTEIILTGKELGEYKDIAELRKLAIDFYKNNIQRKTVEHPVIGKILFTKKGISEFGHYSANILKIKTIPQLIKIVKTAKFVKTEPPNKQRTDGFIKFHTLINRVMINKIIIQVKIIVGEDENGNKFYDLIHCNNEIKKIVPESNQLEQELAPSGTTNNITDFEDNFKDNKEKFDSFGCPERTGATESNINITDFEDNFKDTEIILTGKELGEYNDIAELRTLARQEYRKLQGTSVYHDDLGEIKFTRKGYDKLNSSGADEKKYKLLPKLKEIIETADYINKTEGNKAEIIASHWLENNVILDGKPLRVGITILEDENGNKFYNLNQDLESWNEKYPSSTLVDSSTRPEGYNINITDFEDNFKDEIRVSTDVKIGGYPVSFLLSKGENAIILEMVGFGNSNFSKMLEKHQILERCGWKLHYITSREWNYSKKACVNRIKELL